MAAEKVLHITSGNFEEEVLKSDTPVLVDFWAEWCMPCRIMAPIVEQIAQEYQGRLKVGKVDVDEEMELAVKYGIRGIPTLILFKDGKPASQMVGAAPKREIKRWIDEQI